MDPLPGDQVALAGGHQDGGDVDLAQIDPFPQGHQNGWHPEAIGVVEGAEVPGEAGERKVGAVEFQ